MAAQINLVAEQGATFRAVVGFQNQDGTPVDLTSCTAKMQVRSSYASTSVVAELSSQNGCLTLSGTAGTATLWLAPAATAVLPVKITTAVGSATQYVYDLFVTYPSGDVFRFLCGTFTVTASVTK